MLAGNDQNMYGSLGIDVGKGVDALVLVDGSGRNLAGSDFAEETAHGVTSVQRACAMQCPDDENLRR